MKTQSNWQIEDNDAGVFHNSEEKNFNLQVYYDENDLNIAFIFVKN